MSKRIHNALCVILGVSGFVLILGTAGASDCGIIGLPEIIRRCAVGLSMLAGAFALEIAKGADK